MARLHILSLHSREGLPAKRVGVSQRRQRICADAIMRISLPYRLTRTLLRSCCPLCFAKTAKKKPLYDLNANGANAVCFLKKFEKCATSSKPRLYAICDIFQSVCFSKILASCTMRLLMISVVVLPVFSFNTLLR